MDELRDKIVILGPGARLSCGHSLPSFQSIEEPLTHENNYPINNKKGFASKDKRASRKKRG